jgi:hypothetical protein
MAEVGASMAGYGELTEEGKEGERRQRGAAWGRHGEGEGCRGRHGGSALLLVAALRVVYVKNRSRKEKKRRRKEKEKEKEGKEKKKIRKNMEFFSNLKIFREKNKRQFVKLVKIIFV